MPEIITKEFNSDTPDMLRGTTYGQDWPVVYIIDNSSEAYVGETLDAANRTSQHLQNPERKRLTTINIITRDDYNKSVILDLEAYLIKHMSADRHFKLQNGNMGLHRHNYYNRVEYQKQFPMIWEELRKRKLADNSIQDIENSNIFKYSPYNSLSTDQYYAVANIVKVLAVRNSQEKKMTAIVQGGPGTGKTVLAIYLMKLLYDESVDISGIDVEDDEVTATLAANLKSLPKGFKVGFVVPMQSLRTTLKQVFDETEGLNSKMVISPMEVASGGEYDLLVVDEAHRLRQRKALSQYPAFDKANETLGLGNAGTELDWVLLKSKHQILFYDKYQSVKPSDVDKERFNEIILKSDSVKFTLNTQFRCKGGDEYIEYARGILSGDKSIQRKQFDGYELKLFDDCGVMVEAIKAKDREYSLCRTVAGYAWRWISKSDKNEYDIKLDGKGYRWNTVDKDWVNHPGSLDEIGCIHTIQGYDLNYCAVIFGYEIDYDFNKECFVIDKAKYYDNLAKSVGDDKEALKEYVLNIYKTLMTRGICGTYVYACNENLRKYLKQYVDDNMT